MESFSYKFFNTFWGLPLFYWGNFTSRLYFWPFTKKNWTFSSFSNSGDVFGDEFFRDEFFGDEVFGEEVSLEMNCLWRWVLKFPKSVNSCIFQMVKKCQNPPKNSKSSEFLYISCPLSLGKKCTGTHLLSFLTIFGYFFENQWVPVCFLVIHRG